MPFAPLPAVDVRLAADRAITRTDWLDSRHSFAFGRHYDPGNTSYGLLLAHNDDVLRAGSGFDDHHHRDVEIITWVVSGSLMHQDSAGHQGVLHPGLVQRMSAGSGIVHSERNDASLLHPGRYAAVDARVVQMWVVPDSEGGTPGYEQRELPDARLRSGLVAVAAGRADRDAAVRIGNRDAVLLAARIAPGQQVVLPDAPWVHLFVVVGSVALEGAGRLGAGDAVRLTGAGGPTLTATGQAEVLVWEMHARLG